VPLKLLCHFVGYRFHDYLSPMSLPYKQEGLDAKEVREKARASTAVAGIFVAFVIGLFAALVTILAENSGKELSKLMPCNLLQVLGIAAGIALPYLILWSERKISAADAEARADSRSIAKDLNSAQASSTGAMSQCGEGEHLGPEKTERRDLYRTAQICLISVSLGLLAACTTRELLSRALAPAGLILAFCSLLLLVLSVEFYDTAGGWQRFNDAPYHFHMASIASHCYLMGLSLTLVGSSLLLCLPFPVLGCVVSMLVLAVLLAMTEVEREVFDLSKRAAATNPSRIDSGVKSQPNECPPPQREVPLTQKP
jgi:hypothetical protein